MNASAPPHPSVVLAAYAEPWLRGARVALFGSASLGLSARVVARGARLVHVYDPDRGRVAEALARGGERGVVHAMLPDDGDLGVRDGAFDVVLVPDLSMFGDVASLVALARRMLSPTGVAIVASPSADAATRLLPAEPAGTPLGYYDLFDALSLRFPVVRMLGQVPFVGYAVVDFAAEGEPDVSVDTSVLDGATETPEWYVAVAGQRAISPDAFALVELPVRDVLGARLAPDDDARELTAPGDEPPPIDAATAERVAALEGEVAALQAAVDRERAQALKLSAELDEAQASELTLGHVVEEAESLRGAVEAERRRAEAKRLEAEELATMLAEAHVALDTARAEVAAARLERDALAIARDDAAHARTRAEAARDEALAARAKATHERDLALGERDRAVAEHARLAADRDEARAALATAEQARREAPKHHDALEDEVAALETRVRERGHRVAELEREVGRLRAVGRELVAEIARRDRAVHDVERVEDAEVATLRAYVDRLAADAARREADLAAAAWRVALLERRAGGAPDPAGG